MMNRTKNKKYFLLSIGVLLAALLLAAPVFADGETPTEEPPLATVDEEAQEPAEIGPALENAVPEAPQADDTANGADEPAGSVLDQEPEAEETEEAEENEVVPAPEESGGEQVSDSIPEALAEADLALSDESGAAVDMASAESAEAIKSPDPYYKVGKTYYRFFESANGCDAYPGEKAAGTCFDGEANPIQAAIDNVPNSGLPTDRKIYVETGTYNGGAAFNALATPILGQLNGLIGVYDPDTETRPIINGDVVLDQNVGGFTLSGFTINGYFGSYDGTGTLVLDDLDVTYTTGDGVYISHHDGNVQINNTNSSGNQQRGAYVDNGDPGNNFSVTIKNSYFDENGIPFGNVNSLEIITLGKVALENVSASRNRGSGIRLDTDFSGLTIKNAVLASNTPNPNGTGYGYALYSVSSKKANITLDMVMAGGNSENIETIYLDTTGSVTGKNIASHHNEGSGMYITNTGGNGSVKISESKFTENNNGSGLVIRSNGIVNLSSIDATNNGTNGIDIQTSNSVTISSQKGLGLTGANDFGGNSGTGLNVIASKAITLSNFVSNNNGGTGVYLNNQAGTSGITIKKTLPTSQYYTFYNTTHNNGADGLNILSNGAIRVDYLLAESNTDDGFDIRNFASTKTPGIKVLYTEAHENGAFGMYFESNGSIALTNSSANKNGTSISRDGAYFQTLNGKSGGVTITGTKDYVCTFDENSRRGLNMDVLGNISLKNITANGNSLSTYIANHTANSNRYVKIVNGQFNNTKNGDGLEVISKGNITLDTINADFNDDDGAYIRNTYGSGSISIKNSSFSGNQANYGLGAYSLRNISLYEVETIMNTGYGIYVDNCGFSGSCLGSGSISIKSGRDAYNVFAQNTSLGVFLSSKGNITLSNMIVIQNGTAGMSISNAQDITSGNVILSAGSNMRNYIGQNGSYGLYIDSMGKISVSNTDVMENQQHQGAWINNYSAPKAKTVAIRDSSFLKNAGTGLHIDSLGAVTLQGVDASENSIINGTLNISGEGVSDVLSSWMNENDTFTFNATAGAGYTITLESDFFDALVELRGPDGALIDSDDNSGTGSNAIISGTVPTAGDYTIHVMSADGYGSGHYFLNLNGGVIDYNIFRGIEIDNDGGTGAVKVLYSRKSGFGLRAKNNAYTGVHIDSAGTISISRAEVMNNGWFGIWLDNRADGENSLTLNTIDVMNHPERGINISSRGNVFLKNISSLLNQSEGAYISNNTATKDRWIKVSNSTFSENSNDYGLEIISRGNVSLTNVEAQNPNGDDGVRIDNTSGIGNVTVNGKINVFENNGGDGLSIVSHGEISLTNIMASFNSGRGIDLRNAYSGYDAKNVRITATGGKTMNTLHNNGSESLHVVSFGTISVNKVEAVENSIHAYLQNSGSPDFKTVTVTNSVFNETIGQGLQISANGSVSLSNIWASGNLSNGLYIDNQAAADQDVSVKSSTVSTNNGSGAYIVSSGLVKVDRSTFIHNNGDGVYADNSTGTEGMLVQNNMSTLNASSGFRLFSDGPLTVKNTNSVSNSGMGIYFDGKHSGEKVTLSNVYTALNVGTGIQLINVADVSISGTTSAANGDPGNNSDGIYIDSNGAGVVTISKSTFISNFASGVELIDVGTFTQTNTIIFGNDLDGSGDDDLYVH